MTASTPEDRLLAAMLECGLSESVSIELSAEFAIEVRRELEKERRERVAHELLPLGVAAVTERIGCSRRSVYYLAKRYRDKRKKNTIPCAVTA